MINTKKCRSEFLSLLNNLYNINDKNYYNQIAQQIKSLKQYIKEEYFYDKELPKISHQFINKINQDLEEIENLNNNLLLSRSYDLFEEAKIDNYKILQKASELIKEYQVNSKMDYISSSSLNLSSMLEIYRNKFGEINTIKAL